MKSPEEHRRDKETGLIVLVLLVVLCSFFNWLDEHDKKTAADIRNQEIYSKVTK
jgi:hypothetical protein